MLERTLKSFLENYLLPIDNNASVPFYQDHFISPYLCTDYGALGKIEIHYYPLFKNYVITSEENGKDAFSATIKKENNSDIGEQRLLTTYKSLMATESKPEEIIEETIVETPNEEIVGETEAGEVYAKGGVTGSERNKKIYDYIINAIDPSGYGVETKTDAEKIKFLWDTFKSEYGWRIKQVGPQTAFIDWTQGLPSSFNIDYENYRIIELGKEWGILKENADDREEDKFLNTWWARLFMGVNAVARKNKVSLDYEMAKGGKTYSKGGKLIGASHADGGIKVLAPEGIIETEGGEIIINKEASEQNCELLSEINQSAGDGVKIPCYKKGSKINSKTDLIKVLMGKTLWSPTTAGKIVNVDYVSDDNIRIESTLGFDTNATKEEGYSKKDILVMLSGKTVNGEEIITPRMAKGGKFKQTKAGKAQDKRVKAKHPGKRTTKDGTVYYEYRKNRADVNRTKRI